MSHPRYPAVESEPKVRHYLVRLEGAGAAAPDKEVGAGITATRVAEGHYRLTWADAPGEFLGVTPGWQASTPANLAGHTVVVDDHEVTDKRLSVWVYDAADAADDLEATEKLFLDLRFKQTSASGG
jgi:hypothetical protein